MWLFTPYFFVSIVQKANQTQLSVRARVRTDLDELRDRYLPELSPTTSTPHADYAYRATCTHAALAQAMFAIVMDVTYGNFKGEVLRSQGLVRAMTYEMVWGTLHRELPKLNRQMRPKSTATIPRIGRSRARRAGT